MSDRKPTEEELAAWKADLKVGVCSAFDATEYIHSSNETNLRADGEVWMHMIGTQADIAAQDVRFIPVAEQWPFVIKHEIEQHLCTCPIDVLTNQGCKCGGK